MTDEPTFQCDVLAVKNASSDNDDNDDRKQTLMGILNVLLLCIVLVSCNLIQPLLLVS